MEATEIVLSPAAQREIRKLERRDQIKVVEVLETLAKNPRPRGVEKIQGNPKFYRITAGKNHRVIYHIFQERLIVILVIRDRKEAYRSLGDLDGKLAVALEQIQFEAAIGLRASVK